MHKIYDHVAGEVSQIFQQHELTNWEVKQVLEGMLRRLLEESKK